MKTVRTVLITFGLTTLLYGAFALLTVAIDPAFAGRSIYQLFRTTGFPALIIGIACLLSVIVIVFAYAAFRDDTKSRKSASMQQEEEAFLENETVSVEEYEETFSPVIHKKVRPQPDPEPEEETMEEEDAPALDETLFRAPRSSGTQHCIFCGTAFPISEYVCPKCGKRA